MPRQLRSDLELSHRTVTEKQAELVQLAQSHNQLLLDASHSKAAHESLEAEKNKLESSLMETGMEMESVKMALDAANNSLQESEAKLAAAEKMVEQQREEQQGLVDRLEKSESASVEEFQAQLAELEQWKNEALSEQEKLQDKLQAQNETNESLNRQLHTAQGKLEEINATCASLSQHLELSQEEARAAGELQEQVFGLERWKEQAISERDALANELEAQKVAMEDAVSQLAAAKQQIQQMSESPSKPEEASNEQAILQLHKELAEVGEKNSQLSLVVSEEKRNRESVESELAKIVKKAALFESKFSAANVQRIKLLSDVKEYQSTSRDMERMKLKVKKLIASVNEEKEQLTQLRAEKASAEKAAGDVEESLAKARVEIEAQQKQLQQLLVDKNESDERVQQLTTKSQQYEKQLKELNAVSSPTKSKKAAGKVDATKNSKSRSKVSVKPSSSSKKSDDKKSDNKNSNNKKSGAVKSKKQATSESTRAGKLDDLTRIEGIGPKIQNLLQEAGFRTYASLSRASNKRLNKVLEDAGSRFKSRDPESWPRQASLAAKGEWDQLDELQDELSAGRA